MEKEEDCLANLIEIEDLAEKKAKIYSRLLIEPSLAGEMEKIAETHRRRIEVLQRLLYGKAEKGRGMSALNAKEQEQ